MGVPRRPGGRRRRPDLPDAADHHDPGRLRRPAAVHGGFAPLVRDSTVFVLPLRPDELERAILHPAGRAGVALEPGLVSRIVTDVSDEPGGLPLLQYALAELYEHRAGGTMTMAAYEAMGGAGGALAARAEQLFQAADEPDRRRIRDFFTRLAGLGEGREDVRRASPGSNWAPTLPRRR